MTNYYTENLAEFGSREIHLLKNILIAWTTTGLPLDFENSEVRPAMNKLSGYVFLTNSDCQIAMLNGDRLEIFHSLPESGEEGFLEAFINSYFPDDFQEVDIQYILEVAKSSEFKLHGLWLAEQNKVS